jgi:cysteine desulfuration protein SufE
MAEIPAKLKRTLDTLAGLDRNRRIQMLIDIAEKFREVPPEIATRPFPDDRKVPGCESQAYVWAAEQPGGTLKYYFAVENPQGLSAKATAAILDRALSSAPLEEVLAVPKDVIFQLFGGELSIAKNHGLTNMLVMCQSAARERLEQRN